MREKETKRMDREATEAYNPLPDDLKKEGAWRQNARKEGGSATWARILAGRLEAISLQPPLVARYFGQRDKASFLNHTSFS